MVQTINSDIYESYWYVPKIDIIFLLLHKNDGHSYNI